MNHAPYLSEAEELLLYLNQQPERTASRDALCAQFPDAETQVDEMVNQGLLEFSDWQLEQVRGDGVPHISLLGVESRAADCQGQYSHP